MSLIFPIKPGIFRKDGDPIKVKTTEPETILAKGVLYLSPLKCLPKTNISFPRLVS